VLLTAAVTAALACSLSAELEEDARRRTLLLAGFYASLGLALLSKGLVGLVLPGGIIPLYYLLAGRRPRLARLGVWWGVPLALAVAGVWYGPVIYRNGREFIDQFFVQHHFARFASNKYHHPQPFYFYVPVVLLLMLPWTPFFVSALASFRLRLMRDGTAFNRLRLFALAWLVVPVVFFSFSGSKLPGYVLPSLPAAAILTGPRLLRYLRGRGGPWLMRLTGALVLALGVGGLVYLVKSGLVSTPLSVAVAAPSVVAGACALLLARRPLVAASAVVAASLLTVPLVAVLAVEPFARRESVREPLLAAQARGLGRLPVLQMHTTERSSEFYAAGRLVYSADGQPRRFEGAGEVLEYVRQTGGEALVIVPVKYLDQLTNEPGASTEVVADNYWKALVYVRAAGE
jgi:4-amino-4-deoxy-L-arabinose transferase-like glycosyltransferase